MRRFLTLVAASLLVLVLFVPAHAQAPEKPKITIGVGGKSLFYYLPLTIALQQGYFKSEGLDVEVQDFPGGARALQALLGGSVDVVSELDPVISQLESDGTIVAVLDTRTAKGMQEVYGGAYAAGCIYVPVEFSKKYPNTAQAIVNAMVHALRFIQQSTPDQVVAAVPTVYYTDRAQYKAALEKNIETYKHDGSIGIDAAQAVYRDLKSFDPQIQTVPVDVAKSFNMSF